MKRLEIGQKQSSRQDQGEPGPSLIPDGNYHRVNEYSDVDSTQWVKSLNKLSTQNSRRNDENDDARLTLCSEGERMVPRQWVERLQMQSLEAKCKKVLQTAEDDAHLHLSGGHLYNQIQRLQQQHTERALEKQRSCSMFAHIDPSGEDQHDSIRKHQHYTAQYPYANQRLSEIPNYPKLERMVLEGDQALSRYQMVMGKKTNNVMTKMSTGANQWSNNNTNRVAFSPTSSLKGHVDIEQVLKRAAATYQTD